MCRPESRKEVTKARCGSGYKRCGMHAPMRMTSNPCPEEGISVPLMSQGAALTWGPGRSVFRNPAIGCTHSYRKSQTFLPGQADLLTTDITILQHLFPHCNSPSFKVHRRPEMA